MVIFQSAADAQTIGAPIVRLFITGLARLPDPPTLQKLVAESRSGATLGDIAEKIAAGSEFLARHGPAGAPTHHYVQSLFWAVDAAETPTQQSTELAAQPGATRASLLMEVSQSRRAQDGIGLAASLYPDGLPPEDDVAYQLWLDAQQHGPDTMAAIARHAAALAPTLDRARFSLILQVPPIRPDLVEETVASLTAQLWPRWECLLLCPAGLPPYVAAAMRALADRTAAIRLVEVPDDLPAADACNRALALADGAMVGWIDASDRLDPTALYEAAVVLQKDPDTVLIYTDEDTIGGDGTRFAVQLKPGWSPALALAGDSFGQLTLYDRAAIFAQTGFDSAAAPFERYDLALRLAHGAGSGHVHHVPAILFHAGRLRRKQPPAFPRTRAIQGEPRLAQVVARHLQLYHPGLTLGERLQGNAVWPVVTAALPDPAPRISIIIPTRDRAELLERCLGGLLTETDYPNLEILIVDNGSRQSDALQLLQRAQHDPRVRVLSQPGHFNWSALNNAAAAIASGDILLLLNNDIEVVEPGWLAAIAGQVMRPDIGVVGARLLFPSRRLQHGGVLIGDKGQAVHAMTHAPEEEAGYRGQVALARDLSAVTGACLAIRRAVFEAVGGLEAAQLRVAWSDIDLCLRVRDAGYRVVWLPEAVLVHHEAASRGRDDRSFEEQSRHEAERMYICLRWPGPMFGDPFLNPNLQATATSIVLADRVRRMPPWAEAAMRQGDSSNP